MDRTIDSIVTRLDPGDIVSRSWHQMMGRDSLIRRSGKQAGDALADAGCAVGNAGISVWDKVRENPIPVAIIGAGALWLLLSGNEDEEELEAEVGEHPSKVRQYASEAAHYARDYASGASHAVEAGAHSLGSSVKAAGSGLAHGASTAAEAVSDAAETTAAGIATGSKKAARSVRRGARFTRDSVETGMREHPLAIGATVLGLGVLCGLLLPATRSEDKLFGAERDRLKQKGKEWGREALERGRNVAEYTASAAEQSLQEEGLTPEQLANRAQQAACDTSEAARNEAQRQANQAFRS